MKRTILLIFVICNIMAVSQNDLIADGDLQMEKSNYNEAIKQFKLAINNNAGNNKKVYSRIAGCYNLINQIDSAICYVNLAILQDTTDAMNYISLASYYEKASQIEKARNTYFKIINDNKNYYPAYTLLGTLLINQHKFEDAINVYNDAIKIDSVNLDAYKGRAFAQLNFRNYEGAIADYTFLLNKETVDANVLRASNFYERGICYLNLNKQAQGCNDFKEAAKLNYLDSREILDKYCK